MALCSSCGFCMGAQAATSASPDPTSGAPTSTAPKSAPKTLLNSPQPNSSQREVFAYLQQKCGREVAFPAVPENNLSSWAQEGFAAAGRDSKLLYAVIYEQLLVAQQLLASKDKARQRSGLRLAHDTNFKITMRLHDTWLSSRLFDDFLLPYTFAAPTKASESLNQQRLLQDAASAYRASGEKEKQIRVLRRLVAVADAVQKAQSDNSRDGTSKTDEVDWARVKLAGALSDQEKYQEAIDLLNAVQSRNMSGAKQWIPGLKQKLAAQKRKAEEERTTFKKPTPEAAK